MMALPPELRVRVGAASSSESSTGKASRQGGAPTQTATPALVRGEGKVGDLSRCQRVAFQLDPGMRIDD